MPGKKKLTDGNKKSLLNLLHNPKIANSGELVEFPVKGRRIVNIEHLAKALVCKKCCEYIPLSSLQEESSRAGLCCYWVVICRKCKTKKTVTTDSVVTVVENGKPTSIEYPVNTKYSFGKVLQ